MRKIQNISTSWVVCLLVITFAATQVVPFGFANELLTDPTNQDGPEIPVDEVKSEEVLEATMSSQEEFLFDVDPLKPVDAVEEREGEIIEIEPRECWSCERHVLNTGFFIHNKADNTGILTPHKPDQFQSINAREIHYEFVSKMQVSGETCPASNAGDTEPCMMWMADYALKEGHSVIGSFETRGTNEDGSTFTNQFIYTGVEVKAEPEYPGTIDINGQIASIDMNAIRNSLTQAANEARLASGQICYEGCGIAEDLFLLEGIQEVFEREELYKFEFEKNTTSELFLRPAGFPPAYSKQGWIDLITEFVSRIDRKGADIFGFDLAGAGIPVLVREDQAQMIDGSLIANVNTRKVLNVAKHGVDGIPENLEVVDHLVKKFFYEGISDEVLKMIREDIKVIEVTNTVFNDGCLGWSVMHEACTMAIVPGTIVVLELYGHRYEFHNNRLNPTMETAIYAIKNRMQAGYSIETIQVVSSKPVQINNSTDVLRSWYEVKLASGDESWTMIVDYWSGDIIGDVPVSLERAREVYGEIQVSLRDLKQLQELYQAQFAETSALENEKLWAERKLAGEYRELLYTTMVYRLPEDYAAQRTIQLLEGWLRELKAAFEENDSSEWSRIVRDYEKLLLGEELDLQTIELKSAYAEEVSNESIVRADTAALTISPYPYFAALSPSAAKRLYRRLIVESQAKAAALPEIIADLNEKIEARRIEWQEVARRTLAQYGSIIKDVRRLLNEEGEWGFNEFIRGPVWTEPYERILLTDTDGREVEGLIQIWPGDLYYSWVESRPFEVVLSDGSTIEIEFRNGEMDPLVKEKLDEMMRQNPDVQSMPFGTARIDIEWAINESGNRVLVASIKSQSADGVSEILAYFEVSDYEMKPMVIRNRIQINELTLSTHDGKKIIFNSKTSDDRVLLANYTVYEQIKSESLQSVINKMTRLNLSGNKILKAWERMRHINTAIDARYIGRQIIQSTRWVRNDTGEVTAVNIVRRTGDGSTVRVRKTIDEEGESKYFVKAYKAQPERGVIFKGYVEDARLMRENSGLLLNLSGITENGQVIAIMILPETIRLLSSMDIDDDALDQENLNLRVANLPIDEMSLITPDRYDIRPADLEEFERKIETSRLLNRSSEPTRVFSSMLVSDEGRSLIKYYENLQEKYRIS